MTFRILTVCTGNICRSPQAEQFLRAETNDLDIELSSAGTMAMIGSHMDARAAKLSREHGGDPVGHTPRQLTVDIIDESDLVLALAREHRSAVARLAPRASRRTFTLRELARILDSTSTWTTIDGSSQSPSVSLSNMVSSAHIFRGYTAGSSSDDNVIDPYRRSDETFLQSVEEILPATTIISSALRAYAKGR